MITSTQQ